MIQNPRRSHTRPKRSQMDWIALALGGLIGSLFGCLVLLVALGLWVYRPQIGPRPQVGASTPGAPDPGQEAGASTPGAAEPSQTSVAIPLPCQEPSLTLGTNRFRIATLQRLPDGSLPLSAAQPQVAYWVEGTSPHYVFALAATPENLILLLSAQSGETLTLQWADCSQETFVVRSLQPGLADLSPFLGQPTSGVTLAINDNAGTWVVLDSGWPEAPQTAEDATSQPQGVQAEILILETITSADSATVVQHFSLHNLGSTAISLTIDDIALSLGDGQPWPLSDVQPPLPQTLEAGASLDFWLAFPVPPPGVVVVKILDFSLELYF